MKWLYHNTQFANQIRTKNKCYAPNVNKGLYEQDSDQLQIQIEQNEKELNKYYAIIQLKMYLLDMYDIHDKTELHTLIDSAYSE